MPYKAETGEQRGKEALSNFCNRHSLSRLLQPSRFNLGKSGGWKKEGRKEGSVSFRSLSSIPVTKLALR